MSDMDQNPGDIEKEAERRRAAIRDTSQELKERLSPEGLLDYGRDYMNGPGGRRFLRAVQENPLAALLTAAGACWLFYTASRMDDRPRVSGRQATAYPGAHPGLAGPGVMGDQTQEQNLNQTGEPGARVTETEVRAAFDRGRSTSPPGEPGARLTETEVRAVVDRDPSTRPPGEPGARVTESEVRTVVDRDPSTSSRGT